MILIGYHYNMKSGLITRNTDYAVRALVFMARREKRSVSVSELVRELKIPRPFLRNIMQTLGQKGILKSSRGKRGGFIFAVQPGKIFLTDLMRIFQGALKINECIFKKMVCPNKKTCSLRKELCEIEDLVITRLKNINLLFLAKRGRGL